MPATLTCPADIPATPAPNSNSKPDLAFTGTSPSPETVAWAAGCLAEIGFTPLQARRFGLSPERASELESAMADLLAADTPEASRR